MAYIWSETLETGDPQIDQFHQDLFASMNNLLKASSVGQGGTKVDETLDFLNNYIFTHFDKEETLMAESDYPDYYIHKKAHDTFKKTVHSMVREYDKSGTSISLIAKLNSVISSWLISHIQRDDMKFAHYLRSRNK